ncbi:magnesium/cobalt transporter CorA [Modestobacter sp. SYSU DS0511]
MTDRRRATTRSAPRTALSTLTRRARPLLVVPPQDPPPGPVANGATPSSPSRIVDNAVYSGGRRIATPDTAEESHEWLTEGFDDRMVWLGLYRPQPAELGELAEQYGLPDLAVEDAIQAHQRPKFERYGDTLFVVLKAARYVDATEEVEFGELHLFLGKDFVVTVRHSESPDLTRVRRRLESTPELLARGTEAVLYAILDAVVDGYAPVVTGLENDIDEIEAEVFRGDPQVSRRIYELSQEVVDFQRACQPLTGILAAITAGFEKYGVDEELRSYLRDVADHVTQVNERIEGFRLQLRDILTVNATLVAQRQNDEIRELTVTSIAQGEEVKKISAWAAILFAPSLVGGVYGMNFDNMPELEWYYGYPFALVLMFMVSLTLYLVFKRRDWI